MPIAYIDGKYVNSLDASVSAQDRGYHFSDGIYEVILIKNSKLIDVVGHLHRLERSISEMKFANPPAMARIEIILSELIRRNYASEGIIYLQITRGAAKRNHLFPANSKPIITAFWYHMPPTTMDMAQKGISCISAPDIRWGRRDIKTISLLANILARQEAQEHGAREAILHENGMITEGSSSNCFMINHQNQVITHPENEKILWGITKNSLFKIIKDLGYEIIERPFSLDEAYQAKELFISNTSLGAMPVVKLDDVMINNGIVGEISLQIATKYHEYMR